MVVGENLHNASQGWAVGILGIFNHPALWVPVSLVSCQFTCTGSSKEQKNLDTYVQHGGF